MTAIRSVALSWSSGKDSAWALHLLRQNPEIRVVALITTFNAAFDRVAMHAVRRPLVHEQARSVGLPLWPVELPWPCTNAIYEQRMAELCRRALAERVSAIAFGDLFLRDVREYRERQLAPLAIEPLFPLWEIPTAQLARDMIAAGVKAKVTCVDPSKLAPRFCGRDWDASFLADLPAGVDPCGEYGEFHSFVSDGPAFADPLRIQTAETLERDGFLFTDIVPG